MRKLLKFRARALAISPYLLTVLAIVLPWFLKSGYVFLTDLVWGPNMILDLNWRESWFFFNLAVKFLSFALPFELIQKLFLSFSLLVVLLGGKKIVENFLEGQGLVFVVSLFALFNPFIYDRLGYGQVKIVLAFGFLCLAVGYLLEVLLKTDFLFFNQSCFSEKANRLGTKENKGFKNKPSFEAKTSASGNKQILLAGLFSGLAIQLSAHFLFFAGAFFLLFFGVLLGGFGKTNKKAVWKKLFLAFGLIFVLNINLILGSFFGSSASKQALDSEITVQDLIAFETSGSDSAGALFNVLMMSGFWGKDQFRYFDLTKIKENWGRSFLLFLPLILWGFWAGLNKQPSKGLKNQACLKRFLDQKRVKNRLIIGLVILFLGAVILAGGIKVPIAKEITYWLFNHFPFYKGFRETQKWVAVVVISYLIFFALGIKELFSKKIILKNQFIVKIFLAGLLILQAPLLLFGLNGQAKTVSYPKDWQEINSYLVQENNGQARCEKKILFLPWHLYLRFEWIGNVVANPASKFFECPVIFGKNIEFGGIFSQSVDEQEKEAEKWVFSFGRTNLLQENKFNIGYLILAKEVDWKNYIWIERHPNVEFIRETERLKLYRVKHYESQ